MSNRSVKPSAGLRAFLVLALAIAGLASAAPVAATAQGSTHELSRLAASPVGTWATTVTIQGQPPFPAVFHFTPQGVVLLAGHGAGVWQSTGTNTFTMMVAEGLFLPDNTYLGWIKIQQSPTLNGNTFTSAGTSMVHDANDNYSQTVNVTLSANRT
jgi:hypothetical protein